MQRFSKYEKYIKDVECSTDVPWQNGGVRGGDDDQALTHVILKALRNNLDLVTCSYSQGHYLLVN